MSSLASRLCRSSARCRFCEIPSALLASICSYLLAYGVREANTPVRTCMGAYLIQFFKRFIDSLGSDVRTGFQPLDTPSFGNRGFYGGLIFLKNGSSLLQGLLGRSGIKPLITQRIPEYHAFTDRLGLIDVGHGMPDTTNLPERISERGVRICSRHTDQLVAHISVRGAIGCGDMLEYVKTQVDSKTPFLARESLSMARAASKN